MIWLIFSVLFLTALCALLPTPVRHFQIESLSLIQLLRHQQAGSDTTQASRGSRLWMPRRSPSSLKS